MTTLEELARIEGDQIVIRVPSTLIDEAAKVARVRADSCRRYADGLLDRDEILAWRRAAEECDLVANTILGIATQAIEARRAETLGSVHESAVPKACVPTPAPKETKP